MAQERHRTSPSRALRLVHRPPALLTFRVTALSCGADPGGAEQCFENDGIIDAMLTSFLRGLAALTLTLGLCMIVTPGPARAQDPTERVWIQIESYAAMGNTEARIRTYTPEFDNVNGFNAGGFYAITLGPLRPRRGAARSGRACRGGPHPVRQLHPAAHRLQLAVLPHRRGPS